MTDVEQTSNGGVSLRKCYAAWSHDNDVLKESTSGGAFTELAKVVLKDGGIVVGAAYADGLAVVHRVAHSFGELKALRGVKYVQSVIPKSVYEEMSTALRERRRTLFVGTPCQVAAMRKRFGRDDNLILCDLICFGTPSQSLWLKYVRWLEAKRGKRLRSINPRDKVHGWGRKTYYAYHWADGRVSRKLSLFDPYAQAFYSTLGFRKCCFSCPFRGDGHLSDLTLGDCWGAEMIAVPNAERMRGLSLVVCHNAKGEAALETCGCAKIPVNESLIHEHNSSYFESPTRNARWAEFNADAARLEFGELAKKYKLNHTRLEWAIGGLKRFLKGVLGR